jgi:hypothetical protein
MHYFLPTALFDQVVSTLPGTFCRLFTTNPGSTITLNINYAVVSGRRNTTSNLTAKIRLNTFQSFGKMRIFQL